jgi:3D (Asp-Asp-Asp) domain-containing protein
MITLGALMGFLLFPGGAVSAPPVVATTTLPTYMVAVTAYNAVPEQTDGNPLETASGAYSNPEIVAARSQDLAEELPFGTIIELDGSNISSDETCGFDVVAPSIGYRVIADTMNARYTDRVDVLFSNDDSYPTADKGMLNAADVMGICKGVTIRVVGHVNINRMPKTQVALAALVSGKASELAVK